MLDLPPLPEGFVSYGIDISHHQGEIDWDQLVQHSDSLLSFFYCKATEGIHHVDTRWKENRSSLVALGLNHGAYHFFLPNKAADLQAEHFLNHYVAQPTDLPPVLDAEIEGASDADLIKRMKIWLSKVELKTGRRPIIYTSHHFYRTKFRGAFEGYKFWIANYNKNVDGLDDPSILHWQFSDKGNVPGIKGNVDLNYSKTPF